MAPNLLSDSPTMTADFRKEAAPNDQQDIVSELSKISTDDRSEESSKASHGFKTTLIWSNIITITILHTLGLYAIIRVPFYTHKLTFLWGLLIGQAAGFGVTGGVHRFWTHRSYKAKWPLRVILAICYSIAGQNTIFDWVRDHRVHHKYTETDADPHNSNRGFFFAHVGWLMMRKHPEVIRRGRQIDMSDILADPVVAFHQKYFIPMKLLFCFFIPIFVPIYFWNEDPVVSTMAQAFIRYTMTLNATWFVNSAAHMWGSKPYNKRISPSENLAVSLLAMGEGWHNYHHVFPWDYKAAELGDYFINPTTFLIDMFAKIGWAYDLKQPSPALVRRVAEKHGDGSHVEWHEIDEPDVTE